MARTTMIAVLAAGVFAAASLPAQARGAGEAGELEAARANARAGGPVSERDAELLERWGCLSGTDSKFCRKLSQKARAREDRRRDR